MVKRFSVSVSDDLGSRFEPFKEKLSPSAIFQRALEIEVDREERLAAETPEEEEEMEAIIERLREEKQRMVRAYYEMGRRDGLRRAKHLSYDDLVRAVAFEPPKQDGAMIDFSDIRDDFDGLPCILAEFFTENPELQQDGELYLCDEAEEYVEGLLESLHDFWEQVKDRI